MKIAIRASKFITIPLLLGDSGFKREINSLVFNPTELKCIGLSYKEGDKLYIVGMDALAPFKEGIGIQVERITEIRENKALNTLLKLKCPILGQKVINEDGEKLGKVKDLLLDLDLFYIIELLIKGKMSLWIHRSLVVSISKERIVVKTGKIKKPQHIKLKKPRGIRIANVARV